MRYIIAKLNRVRLRLGLFRWGNYAEITMNVLDEPEIGVTTHGDSCTASVTTGKWGIRWLDGTPDSSQFMWCADAIAHIRRCVRQGVRT